MRAIFIACLVAAPCAGLVAGQAALRAQSDAHLSQNPPATAPPATPQPGGQRGRGRGQGGTPLLSLTTPAWEDGGIIPSPHTQPGGDVSPPLAWDRVPDGVQSFVLVVQDLDVLRGGSTMLHWLVWNIPGTARGLPQGVPSGAELPDGTRQISATGPDYRGPAAPATDPHHHYLFELFALAAKLDVPAVGASPQATRQAVVTAMTEHIRARGTLVGRFRR
jgi:Raf kinase inhibitor-like YbhB/YbcL family protein